MPYHIKELSVGSSVAIFRALGSESRARILELLAERDRNIGEIGAALRMAQPSVTKHVQILEEAGLVTSDYLAGAGGMQKRVRRVHDRLIVEMGGPPAREENVAEIEVSVGLYTNVEAVPTCGLATRERFVGHLDHPASFFLPKRADAQILWSSGGFVEYAFTNSLPLEARITAVDFAAEIGSEAPGFNNDYPSDITLWLDGHEVGTWTSPGDHGGVRGRLNPPWWHDNQNSHGVLKVWRVDAGGASVDGVRTPGAALGDLGIRPWETTRVRLGVKPDARHQGGFTVFGRGFGNYEQDLLLRIHYETAPMSKRNS